MFTAEKDALQPTDGADVLNRSAVSSLSSGMQALTTMQTHNVMATYFIYPSVQTASRGHLSVQSLSYRIMLTSRQTQRYEKMPNGVAVKNTENVKDPL